LPDFTFSNNVDILFKNKSWLPITILPTLLVSLLNPDPKFFMKKISKVCYLMVLTLLCCKKPYSPTSITNVTNYLVVEGVINTGQDSTIIKLSRTVKLSSVISTNPELHALVTVESDANTSFPLTETGNGYYVFPALSLNASTCRLKIVTNNGKTYLSDFVPLKNAPPIDSVNYLVQSTGVQVNVNTHDPANRTTYYRWSYFETYIIHPQVRSVVKVQTVPFDTVVLRQQSDDVYTCWHSDTSSNIILGSSAKLKQDVISNNEITSIPSTSEKLFDRYSILLKQYALTSDAFNYWQQLKKNTEQLGSIFDAQPSQVPGNIHCLTSPSEPVIGYISAGSVSEQRIYIDNHKLPWGTIKQFPDSYCAPFPYLFKDSIGVNHYVNDIPEWIYSGKVFVIGVIQPVPMGPILGYTGTYRVCADCTLRGTNKQPNFWTN
jgi:Domain of unknown function (DUF4249)